MLSEHVEATTSGSITVALPTELRDQTGASRGYSNYGGNCGNVNVKSTNECFAASTEDRDDASEN